MSQSESWGRIRELFEAALELPEEEVASYLDAACTDQPKLRQDVLRLLAMDANAGSFLESPLLPERAALAPDAARAEPHDGAAIIASSLSMPSQGPRGYRLLRKLGQGGLGEVYLARHLDHSFPRQVVVKLVRRDLESEDLRRRLRDERRILAFLRHPYIAQVYDAGATEEGRPYFVMEYVQGEPIDRYVARSQLSLASLLQLFLKVCSAVQHAHQNLVVHRDLKPANILVTDQGEPKLLDFGLAKVLNQELSGAASEPTRSWMRFLTPHYASPEQVQGAPLGTASDVYSLGVLLYRLLSGVLPWDWTHRTPAQIERALSEETPRPPSVAVLEGDDPWRVEGRAEKRAVARSRLLQGDLDAIVMAAMRSDPSRRYASAEGLAEDLRRYVQGMPVRARVGNRRYRVAKLICRQRGLVGSMTAVFLMLITSLAALSWQNGLLRQERDRAAEAAQRTDTVLSAFLATYELADPYRAGGAPWTLDQALAATGRNVRRRLQQEPAMLAESLRVMGTIHSNLGDWTRAARDLEEAVQLLQQLPAPPAETLAPALARLGLAKASLGEPEAAQDLTREAVQLAEQYGISDQALARVLNHRVTVLCRLGEIEAAELPSLRALEAARRPWALEPLADALANRATVLLRRAEHSASAELYQQSLALLEVLWHEDDFPLAPVLNNLGAAQRRSGDLDSAQQTFARGLEIHRRLQLLHPDRVVLLNNLAQLARQRGDQRTALRLYEEARQTLAELSGAEHPRVWFLDLQQAKIHLAQAHPEAAVAQLQPTLGEWKQRLGQGHRWILQAQDTLAQALLALGELAAAEAVLHQALGSTEEVGSEAEEELRLTLQRVRQAKGQSSDTGPLARKAAQRNTPLLES